MLLNVIPTATIIFFWVLVGIFALIDIILLISYITDNKQNKKLEVIDWSPKEPEKSDELLGGSFDTAHPSFKNTSEVHKKSDSYTFNFGLPYNTKGQQCCEDFLKREHLKKYRKLHRDNFLKIISSYTYNSAGMKILLEYARQMLENPTIGESLLYKYFSNNKIKYFPQQIICCQHSYIMDVYLPDYHLDIEVDGGYHRTREQQAKDWARSKDIFDTFRIKTIRLTNKQLETGYFVTKLENALKENKIE